MLVLTQEGPEVWEPKARAKSRPDADATKTFASRHWNFRDTELLLAQQAESGKPHGVLE